MIPIHYPTDREAVDAALKTCGLAPPERTRVVWIRNTLELEEIICSESFRTEVEEDRGLEVLPEAAVLRFTDDGSLVEMLRTS